MADTFGTRLRELRRAVAISQRELAERVGLDFSYISKVENDRIPPPAADTIVAICRVLKVAPDDLLALTGKMPSDVQKGITASTVAQEFLREAHEMGLSDDEWKLMLNSLQHLRGSYDGT